MPPLMRQAGSAARRVIGDDMPTIDDVVCQLMPRPSHCLHILFQPPIAASIIYHFRRAPAACRQSAPGFIVKQYYLLPRSPHARFSCKSLVSHRFITDGETIIDSIAAKIDSPG